jgi:hypothetical protein
MSTKRRALIVAAVAVFSIYCFGLIRNLRHQSEVRRLTAALQSLPLERFTAAAQKFSRDRGTNNSPVPLVDLVSGGYLGAADAAPFEGAKVMVYPNAEEEYPAMLMVEAQTRDGLVLARLADGSVQGFSRRGLEELRKSAGQQGGPAKRNPPTRSETN